MMRFIPYFAALVLFASGCAQAVLDGDAGSPCPEGYIVGDAVGECSIPTIGPGEVETPEGDFVAPSLDNDDLTAQRRYFLSQDGDGRYQVYLGDRVDFGVSVIAWSGAPAEGRRVRFEIIEHGASGAQLTATTAETNGFGLARTTVIGGPHPAYFEVRMTSDDSTELVYHFNVVQRPDGELGPGEVDAPGGGDVPPPDVAVQCPDWAGSYNITSLYQPGQVLGDGVFGVLQTINGLLSNPGDYVADLIEGRIGGFWGAAVRAAVRPVVDYLFDYVVNSYLPGWGQNILIFVEDITGILTELEIQGQMNFGAGNPAADCSFKGTHNWTQLVIRWRAGCAANDDACGRFEVPLNELGQAVGQSDFDGRLAQRLGPMARVEIDAHQMRLNLGVAIIWFIENRILPARFGVNSIDALLQQVIPCEAVGQLAADYLSNVPLLGFAVGPFVEDACESAMEAAGNALTRQLAGAISVDTFEVAGTCALRDGDANMQLDQISEGEWTGRFGGTFTGTRAQ